MKAICTFMMNNFSYLFNSYPTPWGFGVLGFWGFGVLDLTIGYLL